MLIDDAISTVNATLLANLTWLDNAYGKIQRMKGKDAKGKDITYPGVYVGEGNGTYNDYESVLPDEKLGNYCYWEVSDPTEYDVHNRNFQVRFNFKISFWFNWIDIFGADNYKAASIEEVKLIILNVLAASQYTRSVETFKVYEDANSIFQNFTNQGYISSYDHKLIQGQFMMKPFGGVAFSGQVVTLASCTVNDVDVSIPGPLFSRIPANYSLSEQIWPLQTWFNETMYWRTWNLGSGINDLEALTGLTSQKFPIRSEYRAINTVTGSVDHGVPQLVLDGGTYKVFTPDYWTDIFVTVYYK